MIYGNTSQNIVVHSKTNANFSPQLKVQKSAIAYEMLFLLRKKFNSNSNYIFSMGICLFGLLTDCQHKYNKFQKVKIFSLRF